MPRRSWLVLVLVLTFVCLYAQERTPPSLSIPPYHNLPTSEGYFQGADGARMFYRVVGEKGDPVVFLHGGPGLGLDDGGYDMEPLAADRTS